MCNAPQTYGLNIILGLYVILIKYLQPFLASLATKYWSNCYFCMIAYQYLKACKFAGLPLKISNLLRYGWCHKELRRMGTRTTDDWWKVFQKLDSSVLEHPGAATYQNHMNPYNAHSLKNHQGMNRMTYYCSPHGTAASTTVFGHNNLIYDHVVISKIIG